MHACGFVFIVMVLCLVAFWAAGALLLYFVLILFTFLIMSFCVFKEGSWDYTLETQLLCLDWVVRLCYFILFYYSRPVDI